MQLGSDQQCQLNSDLLRAIIKLCIKRHVLETKKWQLGFLRGVCRKFRDWCDALAPVLLQELDYELHICNEVISSDGTEELHAWAQKLLAATPRLAINVPVFYGEPNDEDSGEEELILLDVEPTQLLTHKFLGAAACVKELKLQQLALMLARTTTEVLAALPFLQRLIIDLSDDSNEDIDAPLAWERFGEGLGKLQSLKELAVWAENEDLLADLDLNDFGPSLPASLTSLSLGLTPEEEYRTQDDLWDLPIADLSEALGHLVNLQRLRLCSVLAGPQQVPPALAGLTYLELLNNNALHFESSFAQLTGLQHLDLSNSGLQGWPEGLPGMTGLTFLAIEGNEWEGEDLQQPPDFAALSRLQHLVLKIPPEASCPDLAALGDLRRLELASAHLQLPELLLGPLTRLTSLKVDEGVPGGLDLSACSGLRRLEVGWVEGDSDGAFGSPRTPVAGLAGLAQLTALLLRRCTLEPELDLGGLTRLRKLELQQCRLRRLPQGTTALTGLLSLNLMRNRIVLSDQERAWLRSALPDSGSAWDVNREAHSVTLRNGQVFGGWSTSIHWRGLSDEEGDSGSESDTEGSFGSGSGTEDSIVWE